MYVHFVFWRRNPRCAAGDLEAIAVSIEPDRNVMRVSRPWRWRLRWVVLAFVLIPLLLPGVILSGMDQVLRVMDRHSHRYVDIDRGGCSGYRLFAQRWENVPKFDLTVLLIRAALRDEAALDFFKYDGRFENAHCPATERWMRNNGWPPPAELERRAKIPAPRLILLLQVGEDGLAEYPVHAGSGGGRDDKDFLLFSWSSERDRHMRDTLVSAMPELKDAFSRQAVVARIKRYPAVCREIPGGQGMSLTITVARVHPALTTGLQHEVRRVSVWACLEKQIDECEWSGAGLTLARFEELLDTCRRATQFQIERGANLDGYVSDALEERNMTVDALFRSNGGVQP